MMNLSNSGPALQESGDHFVDHGDAETELTPRDDVGDAGTVGAAAASKSGGGGERLCNGLTVSLTLCNSDSAVSSSNRMNGVFCNGESKRGEDAIRQVDHRGGEGMNSNQSNKNSSGSGMGSGRDECEDNVKGTEPRFSVKAAATTKSHNGKFQQCEGASSSLPDLLSPDMDFLDFDFDPTQSGEDSVSDDTSDNDLRASPVLHQSTSCFADFSKNDLQGPGNVSLPVSLSFQDLKLMTTSTPQVTVRLEDNKLYNPDDLKLVGERANQNEPQALNNTGTGTGGNIGCKESTSQPTFTSDPCKGDSPPSSGRPDSVRSQEENAEIEEDLVVKTMIWSANEAYSLQVTQIGKSACGATAVLNMLLALKVPYNIASLESHIHTHLRAETATLATYLLSRSIAGTSHADMISGAEKITGGLVYGRFFHCHPRRRIKFLSWLAHWISKGAVPILTLNLQRGVPVGQSLPDAWHHQMVFGVGPSVVYLTNPLECCPMEMIQKQICSDSVLLVRREDVIQHWGVDCDLSSMLTQSSPRWVEYNVLGQVANILRENAAFPIAGYRRHCTSHVLIPTTHKSGVSLFIRKDSDAYTELASCPDLPLDKT